MKTTRPVDQVLQYVRLSSNPDDKQFEARLALAIHRQSTAPGFIASLEGAVMAEADAWIALIAWSQPEHAERATEEWFHSDYHADFAQNVTEIEANEIFEVPFGIFSDMHGSRHARFLWIEHFDSEDSETWPRYLSRRMSDLHSTAGFADAFAFGGINQRDRHGLVSSWNDALLLRQASGMVKDQNATVPGLVAKNEYLRITSTNTASS